LSKLIGGHENYFFDAPPFRFQILPDIRSTL
jgi:hypothetical protein